MIWNVFTYTCRNGAGYYSGDIFIWNQILILAIEELHLGSCGFHSYHWANYTSTFNFSDFWLTVLLSHSIYCYINSAVDSVFLSNQINKITSENYVYVHSFGERKKWKNLEDLNAVIQTWQTRLCNLYWCHGMTSSTSLSSCCTSLSSIIPYIPAISYSRCVHIYVGSDNPC